MRSLVVVAGMTTVALLIEPYALFVIGQLACFTARPWWRTVLLKENT